MNVTNSLHMMKYGQGAGIRVQVAYDHTIVVDVLFSRLL